jgi:hypothetical protein
MAKPLESDEKASVTLPGKVEKIIPPFRPTEPEKAQIAVEGAEELYREIRIDNVLKDDAGDDVSLKPGAKVDVTIEATPDAVKSERGSE